MKILYLDNVASHYRKAVFLLMDKTFDIDYLFGASLGDIKQMDTSILRGHVEKTQTKRVFGRWYWQPGLIGKLFKSYDKYLLIGETHALSTWLFCMLANLIGKRKRVYFWTHGWYGKESGIERSVKKFYYRLAGGGLFLYGNYARELMIKEGFNPEKLYVIHNSLDYSNQLALRNNCGLTEIYKKHFGNDNPVLVMIGRLNMRKHLDMLIEAVSILRGKGGFYNIVLIGDGEDKEKLVAISESLGISDQVWFYGACYDEGTNANLIFNADLCVVPGDVGLTAIHSMMFGTPVISHNHFPFQGPEFEAIVPGITGEFFEFGSVDSLSKSISEWFEKHNDRDKVRAECYHEIDTQWTPEFQIGVLSSNLTKMNTQDL